MGVETLRKQCWYACQLLRDNLVPAFPYSFIGKTRGIDKGTVMYHYKGYATLGVGLGRYPSLRRRKTKRGNRYGTPCGRVLSTHVQS
jgi:hypothetical protein